MTATSASESTPEGIVGGLLARLEDDAAEVGRTLAILRECPDLLVGEPGGGWLPLALEAKDPDSCRDRHEWIASLPGIASVEVVSVDFITAPLAGEADGKGLSSSRPEPGFERIS